MIRVSNLRLRRASLTLIAGFLAAAISPARAGALMNGADTASPVDQAVAARDVEGPVPGLVFAKNRAALDEAARAALQPLLQALLREPELIIELQGHTDNRGPAGGNLVLSKRRVMAVVRFLVSEGVEPSRLQPWGYGENRPILSNATAEGRARNRRIEVRVIMPRNETER